MGRHHRERWTQPPGPACRALPRRDVVIVRTLCRSLRQTGVRFTDTYLSDTLAANPDPVRLTVELFHLRLDPTRARDEQEEAALVAELARAVDAVASLDADRILRALWSLVAAVVRTNVYLGAPYVAVKFDPGTLDFLPRPRPQHCGHGTSRRRTRRRIRSWRRRTRQPPR